jgi:hypothetical protein
MLYLAAQNFDNAGFKSMMEYYTNWGIGVDWACLELSSLQVYSVSSFVQCRRNMPNFFRSFQSQKQLKWR